MPDIVNSENIDVLTGENFNLTLTMYSMSTSGANDGRLPYGTTVSSVAVSGYTSADVAANDLLNGNTTIQNFPDVRKTVLTTPIKHPGATGYYKLRYTCTLNTNEKMTVRFNRVNAE